MVFKAYLVISMTALIFILLKTPENFWMAIPV